MMTRGSTDLRKQEFPVTRTFQHARLKRVNKTVIVICRRLEAKGWWTLPFPREQRNLEKVGAN
ncbi:hypothetical protein FOPG_19543 [Fusarium oxysporum f. sp. conglutinans race 2 54008]|uniref:Uncharacterized protein n=1 Tax=Fusarium oxysporum f. sp. conglutinans race 2 54008 TaxID=1089457 RepID=X0GKL7_FUSOX|nr:hypothetical protein FOPG_19543 [Fusarium oxysporum f. sp. conglutinans race 2 54008]